MVLFALHARFKTATADAGSECKTTVKLSTRPIPVQKIKLCGYQIAFKENNDAGGNTALPNHIVLDLDWLSSQIHVASPPEFIIDNNTTTNTDIYPHTTGIPLSVSDGLHTIKFGLDGIEFELGKQIPRKFDVSVHHFNNTTGKLEQMIQPTTNNGTAILQHIILYFNYDFAGLF